MKDIQQALLDAVGDRLTVLGFDKKPLQQSFIRPVPGGRGSFHLSFIRHEQSFDVVADVAVRLDALEDLVNATSSLLSEKEKSQTSSLGAELGNLAGEGQKRWTVATIADIGPVADQLVMMLKAAGLPYLEAAATPESAYRLLTSPGPSAWLHSPIHASRAKRVVGLALLMGRKNEAAVQALENCRMLESMADPGLVDFRRFVASLGVEV